MNLRKPVFFVLGPSWYGEWAKDFHAALNEAGVEARLIHTNTLGAVDLGDTTKTSTNLLARAKALVRKTSPWLVELMKSFLRAKAERQLLEQVKEVVSNNREAVVLFLWTPPKPGILKKLEKGGARLLLWQGEAPVREPSWAESFDYFERIFIFDEIWRELLPDGVRARAYALPTASTPARYHPLQKNPKFACEVAFVGLYRKERAETLAVLKDHDMRIYGYHWKEGFPLFPWLKEKYHGPVAASEVNEIFNSAKIVIGSFGMGTPGVVGETITQRTFEIPLAGNFQIGFYCPATIPAFDNSIVMFKDREDLKRLVAYYLPRQRERELMARKAHQIALQRHTYLHRAKEMLRVLGYA